MPVSVAAELSNGKLRVATKEAPPFSMKNTKGSWEGISIELWENISDDLNIAYELKEMSIKEMIAELSAGTLDAGVAAMTVTYDREVVIDFSHPFYTSGLGIAVGNKKNPWYYTLTRFASINFLKVTLSLIVLLLTVGALVWWFERRKNPNQFGGKNIYGIISGFWWSAVTMTTVGYGDKAPISIGGRIVALIWMFTAIIIISSFTAAITSSLTISQLETMVNGPEDLPKVRVGSTPNTTSGDYLSKKNIYYTPYETPSKGLTALSGGEIDAFVYDRPILQYLVNRDYSGRLHVIKRIFNEQNYAIALPPDSKLRESINKALLKTISDPQWPETVSRYLGK